MLDTNSDNSVTLDELTAGAPGGATATSSKRTEALFKAMDADGSGGISEDEKTAFDQKVQDRHAGIAFLAQQLGGGTSNADVFSATDTNSDGAVSFDEFSADDAAKGVDSSSLQKVFDLIDANGDGSISSTESSDFLDTIKQALAQHAPAPGGGGGGLPPLPPPDRAGTTDLLSLAQNAYSKSTSSDLLSTLEGLLKAA